ncbi:VRR-NUC domain-containing protein [Microbulbifer pacificus]|uniref:VRR-NUC domain-containing protein n=1 Tax=Microbulbifer pacificus TaxID=407164 RepID=A0AAU0MYK9_9GAMM|nr:VRR-NUC domain-containing protein [Microbulbifer pacificus]WOX05589.1 VRR-NUC domain-containing protein [Microbulbifer pacificus]
MPAPVELAPDYYLTNFLALVDFVMSRYEGLLSAGERRFYADFRTLDVDSQRLYVRLLPRKGVPSSAGSLFRQRKLAYAEIGDLATAADRLVETGLLQRNPPLEAAEVLPLYSKAELVPLSSAPLPRSLKRPELAQALLQQGIDTSVLSAEDPLLAVQAAEHFETFKLCFFGNLNQDLTDWVLRDLGLFQYEQYALDCHHLPFQNRAQIEQHLRYYDCLSVLDDILDSGAEAILTLAQQLPPADAADATLQRRLDRVRLTMARQLERLEVLDAADQLYRLCARPPARERRARIAVARGDIDGSLSLCREILAAPLSEAEEVFAESFGYRTAKREQRPHGWAAPSCYQAPTETVALPSAAVCVELIAAAWLEVDAGGPCHYVENTLFNGILGLYVWDIVFAPLPGAFFNPFQAAPSDFRTPDFYPSRRQAFEQRLAELDCENLAVRVWQNFDQKYGIANPLVAWDALSAPLLRLALERIPAAHWQALFRRLLADIANHRSGLPDLIRFPDAGGYELVEVKGPGDRLQQNQQRWLAFFARHEIPHRVLHVEWQAT